MKMTDHGRKLLMEREGCRLKAYKDSVGVWTIGVGHTSAAGPPQVKAGMSVTRAQAEHIFADDLVEFEDGVNALIGGAPIQPHQFDAFVSLAFNIGLGAFASSTALRQFLDGAHDKAAEAILLWNKPPEVKSRRRGEHQQFLNLQHVARA
jgi:lysozyme